MVWRFRTGKLSVSGTSSLTRLSIKITSSISSLSNYGLNWIMLPRQLIKHLKSLRLISIHNKQLLLIKVSNVSSSLSFSKNKLSFVIPILILKPAKQWIVIRHQIKKHQRKKQKGSLQLRYKNGNSVFLFTVSAILKTRRIFVLWELY